MKLLTLIPETTTYGVAILLTCALGCSNMASHIHSRWCQRGIVNVIQIHWLVKAVIVLLGAFIIPFYTLFDAPLAIQLIALPIAYLLGILALRVELAITRQIIKKNQSVVKFKKARYSYQQVIANKTTAISTQRSTADISLKAVHEHHAQRDFELMDYQMIDIILVAITEEIIFRGYLWKMSLLLPTSLLTTVCLILSVILFGASHITMGSGQFMSKCVLGALCLGSTLLLNTILPALLIHVIFNLYAYREMKAKNINPVFNPQLNLIGA